MATFSRLVARGLRRLEDLDVELRPLTVMIGANGVGKSSVLEALSLLSASAEGSLKPRVGDLGGIGALLTVGTAARLTLGTRMEVAGDAPLDYSLTLAPRGQGYVIEKELLSQQRNPEPPPFKHIESEHPAIRYYEVDEGKLVVPTWEHDAHESSLAQVPKMFREPEQFRQRLASATLYHTLDVAPRAPVRLPQPMQAADLPGARGESLVSCLYYLRETDRDRYDNVEESVRAAFPSFERFDFPPVAAGTLSLTWRDKAFTGPLYAHQLSEGTLRFLWLATLLQSPGIPTICMIDEPEVSLHPEMLSLLAELLREASDRTLLVIATHSDRLIRFLEPREVLVMDIEQDGTASATWADSLDLDRWLAEYTLDEVWRLGRIGGRA